MSKEIYNNGSSKCIVGFDGVIIVVTQEVEGEKPHSIFLYEDELKRIAEYVAMKKSTNVLGEENDNA